MTDSKPKKNLKVEIEKRIATVTICRPAALNALNRATLRELYSVFAALEEDQSVGAVILTGEGEKAFVAGADIKEMAGLNAVSAQRMSAYGQNLFRKIETLSKPVIAAVNGFCLGGGCELALSCHLRIASENARFGQPEVKLGLIPGYGGTQRLPKLVGKGIALEMILSGEMIDAGQAAAAGLVNRVVPPGDLISVSRELCHKILANAPLAIGLSIQAVNASQHLPLEEGLALEAGLFGVACGSEDMKEGVSAFVEKRKAEFKGR